jgi:hypothetical protein
MLKKKLWGMAGIVLLFTFVVAACPTAVDEEVKAPSQTPVITTQPQGYIAYYGDESFPSLKVVAEVSDGGVLSYQWMETYHSDKAGSVEILDATGDSYTPVFGSDALSTVYYWVKVTNTASGKTPASVDSDAATIRLFSRNDAQPPTIITHPQDASFQVDQTITALTVTATVTEGNLTYQWYSNTLKTNAEGTLIDGATTASYQPVLTGTGVYYYYVEVTNTNPAATGNQTSMVASNVATITITARPATDNVKLNKNGIKVENHVYLCTPEADPRVVLGYKLGGTDPNLAGKQFFDTVILFNAAIRDRDCSTQGSSYDSADYGGTVFDNVINGKPDNHNCNKTGIHLHFDNAIQYVLDNRDTYIKPLQDAGIRVILCILGDWSTIGHGLWEVWPFENYSPVAGPGHEGTGYGAAPPASWANGYPYTAAARDAWLQELKTAIDQYGLDGVDFDDEWSSRSVREYEVSYPGGTNLWMYSRQVSGFNYGGNTYASAQWAQGGTNMARMLIRAKEILGQDKIVSVYEYNNPRRTEFPETVAHPTTGVTVSVADYVDYAYESVWGSSVNTSYVGLPNPRYARTGIDIGGGDRDRATPAMTGATKAIETQSTNNLNGNYGVNIYYDLQDRRRYQGYRNDGTGLKMKDKTRFFDTVTGNAEDNGEKNMPEMYLSYVSNIIYGAPVVYDGAETYWPWRDRRIQPWESHDYTGN